ncbi:hypothetical protein, partial [Gordonia sp. (in: high G+C Gram-positive bacteria)]|uniref:hypothetical protein n=1 Tax=Gordonia sp. (in: high G+C Gram-positive bacteria) TaxID=84139 RepID=UPI0039E71DC6
SGTPVATGRLADAADLVARTDRSTMVTLPSPGYLTALAAGTTPDAEAAAALARIVRAEILALAADGVPYVLVRNPALGMLLHRTGRARAAGLGLDADALSAAMITADNAAVAAVAGAEGVPEHFRVGLDVTTAGVAEGAYDEDAVKRFLDTQAYRRICVEFPAETDDRFPLTHIPEGVVVSLGLVDITTPVLEDVDDLVSRVDEATEDLDIDDIALSTNGGFHAVPACAEYQFDKLRLVETTARYFWGNEL